MVWIALGALAAIGLGIEVRSWRRSSRSSGASGQQARHGPWPSMGTDRSTQPNKD
jgi:hypothetical protein